MKVQKNKNDLIYKSKPNYILLISIVLGSLLFIYLDYLTGIPFKFRDFIFYFSINYFLAFTTIVSFEFYERDYNKKYLFRPPPIFRMKKFDYKYIYMVEIKDVVEPYSRPMVILHFDKNKINSFLIFRRACEYKKFHEIEPLIIFLLSKGIKIKNNIQRSSYDAEQLKNIIKEYKLKSEP